MITLSGVAGQENGASVQYGASGQLRSAASYRALSRVLPEDGVPVDLDHEPGNIVGEVVHAELAAHGRLEIVAVADADWLLRVADDRPVYFSGEFGVLGDDGDDHGRARIHDAAYLRRVALTFTPARVGATVVRLRAGDVRSTLDRSRWPMSYATADPILARAAARRPGERATRITEQRALDDLVDIGSGAMLDKRTGELAGVVNRTRATPPALARDDDRRPPGPIEYRPARIIRVR